MIAGTGLRSRRAFAHAIGVGPLFWQAASGRNPGAVWFLIMFLDEYEARAEADFWRRILAQDATTTVQLAIELARVGAYRSALHWAAQAASRGDPAAVRLRGQILDVLDGRPAPAEFAIE